MTSSVLKTFRSPEKIRHVNVVLAGCLSAPSDDELEKLETISLLIGAKRSGATMIAAILDAHPEIVMAKEFNLLRQFQNGLNLKQAARLMLFNARMFAKKGAKWTGYSYDIPGMYQGRYETLKVIGDKKAQTSTLQLQKNINLIGEMEKKYARPVKMIHAVRNPYDTLASMVLKKDFTLERAMQNLEDVCQGAAHAYLKYPSQVLLVRQEDLLKEAGHMIRAVTEFLGLKSSEEYLKAAAQLVRPDQNMTRHKVEWTEDIRNQVEDLIDRHEFLNGYRF